jgi:hypothetical protein
LWSSFARARDPARDNVVRLSLIVATVAVAASLRAQGGQPPPVDSTRTDSTAARVVRDSVKTPYAVAPAPPFLGVGRPYHWLRDELFQTGATSVAELIERIPGAGMMRSGLVLAPQVITWWGETGRVRVFLDGIELDGLDRREQGIRDLGAIAIWELEEVTAETTPGELRVHLHSWRVARTAAETRVDVLTGDEETNVYRGYYGRRFQSGLGVQFGFQQLSSDFRNVGGDGDAVSLFGRLGWARNAWAFDVTTQRDRRTRNATAREDVPGSIPALTGHAVETFARAAWHSPDAPGAWLQILASNASFKEKTPSQTLGAAFGTFPVDSADTTAARSQFVVSGGFSRSHLHANATARYRRADGDDILSPALRLSWDGGRLTGGASVERNGADSLLRADAGVRIQPFSRLGLSVQISRRSPVDGRSGPAQFFAQAEAQLQLGRFRFTGGAVRRDTVTAAAPAVFARGIASGVIPAATGETFGMFGRIYKAIFVEGSGTLWNAAAFYRSRNDLRARLGLDTEWRSRFPKGDFTIRASGMVEHRGGLLMPIEEAPVILPAATALTSMLEIRIKSATITWQFRNFLGAPYETVPGYSMPSRINLYGVRWNFSN